MVKYPEVNTMHKKMLRVSEKVHSLEREAEGSPVDRQGEALDELWAAQCNCPYWHGVFGGIYLPHIRTANYEHLLTAENLADKVRRGSQAWVEVSEVDLDRDSQPELLIEGTAMNLYFDPARGGTLFEWDWRVKKFNLLNNLTRRPEGYHQTLVDAALKKAQEEAAGEGEEVLTIHDIVRAKEEGLEKLLYYDWYRRTALIDHFLHSEVELESFYRADYGEAGDFVAEPFAWQVEPAANGGVTVRLYRDGGVWVGEQFCPVRLEKAVHVVPGALELPVSYTILNKSAEPLETRFGVEFNFGLLSGHADDAYYRIPGLELDDRHLDSKGETEGVSELALVHEYFGLEIALFLDGPATLWRLPIEAISNSESGFERVYQCSCILPHWSIRLEAGESWKVRLRFALREL
jgi:alpha-amylase